MTPKVYAALLVAQEEKHIEADVLVKSLGEFVFKGIKSPTRVFEVTSGDLARRLPFPALRAKPKDGEDPAPEWEKRLDAVITRIQEQQIQQAGAHQTVEHAVAALRNTGYSYHDPNYDSFSLSKYRPDSLRLYINKLYPGLQMIHPQPVFLVHDFLSPAECAALCLKGASCMKPSKVANVKQHSEDLVGKFLEFTGLQKPAKVHTRAFDFRRALEVRVAHREVPRLHQKISELTNAPVCNFETLKISSYENGGFFKSHQDNNDKDRNPRICTVIMYLTDVHEGGETVFPTLDLSVKPKRGTALVFFPGFLHPVSPQEKRRSSDFDTRHEAQPVIVGPKLICQQWVRASNPIYSHGESHPIFKVPFGSCSETIL